MLPLSEIIHPLQLPLFVFAGGFTLSMEGIFVGSQADKMFELHFWMRFSRVRWLCCQWSSQRATHSLRRG